MTTVDDAAAVAAARGARSARFDFFLAFVCIFGGLSLPLPGLASFYVRVHGLLGGALLPSSLTSGVLLRFLATSETSPQQPWSLTLSVTPPGAQAAINVPIDLRALIYLPSVCFIALALATPLPSRRKNLELLSVGLLMLEPLLVGLVSLPLISFLGGTGPVRAFELGLVAHTILQVVYRALVASPSMAYVIPLILWWVLLPRFGFPKSETFFRISKTPGQSSQQ